MKKNEGLLMSNLVWRRFVATQLPDWIAWFKNNHVPSHIVMIQKFIMTHPYFIPNAKEVERYAVENELLESLMVNKEFLESLSDKGCEVWYNSTFLEFVDELRPYEGIYKEFKYIVKLFDKYNWWFNRVYLYMRNEIADHLESIGRSFK